MNSTLKAFVGEPQRRGRLTLFPIVAQGTHAVPHRLLAQAVRRGEATLEVYERRGEERIVDVRVLGRRPVLVVNGELLRCGVERCMTSQSVLLPPKKTSRLKVSLAKPPVPDLAWSEDPAADLIPEAARGRKKRKSAVRLLEGTPGPELKPWVDAFPSAENQVGLLAFLGRRFLGLDTVGAPSLYNELHSRLVAGYALASLAAGPVNGPFGGEMAEVSDAQAIVEALEAARRLPAQTEGLGQFSVLKGALRGGELIHEGHLVHLTALPTEEGGS